MAMPGSREIEDYLLGDMTDEEQEKIEERLLTDDEFFFEVSEAENALTDRYVRDKLDREQTARFESKLTSMPSLASKVANARTLNRYITLEREPNTALPEVSPSLWQRISSMFSFATPAPAFAMGGLLLFFAVGFGLLVLENGRRNAEISKLEAELSNSGRSSQREAELEREIAGAKEREATLQGQIDGEKDITGDLTADLERERESRRRLQNEIDQLRKEIATPIKRPTPDSLDQPKIIALTLSPIGARGGGDHTVNFEGSANRVSVLLKLTSDAADNERISVRLNGREIARNLAVRPGANGVKSVSLTIMRSALNEGANRLTAHNSSGNQIGEYDLGVGDVTER